MKKLLLITLTAIVSLSAGCSILGQPVAEKVAEAIDKYCEEPQSARGVYREHVNAELALEGHSIAVTCNGDLPE